MQYPIEELRHLSIAVSSQRNPAGIRRAVLDLVRAFPGRLPRAAIARILVGTPSARETPYKQHPAFASLDEQPRWRVLNAVDILLAEGELVLDRRARVRPVHPWDGDGEAHF